jgi:hypothetical protein
MAIAIGLGNTGIRTTDIAGGPTNQKLLDYPTFNFTLEQESQEQEALRYVAGKHQVEEAFESSVTTTLTLSTEIPNWPTIGFALGQLERTLTSFTVPTAKQANVPTGTTEISDPAITATSAAKALACVQRKGTWGEAGPLTTVTTAPASASEVQFDTTNNKMVFHSSLAGAPILYVLDVAIASAEGYGGPGTLAKLGEMEFFGEVYTNSSTGSDGGIIWIPRIQRSARPSIAFTGDKVTLENQFKCLAVSGWEEPYTWVRSAA